MAIMRDANGNPVIVSLDQMLQRLFDMVTDSLRVEISNGQATAGSNPLAVTQAPKAAYQNMKTFTGTVATSATLTTTAKLNGASDYVVPAGKTFYVTDIIICNNTANAATITLQQAGSAMITGHALNTSPFDAINIGTEPSAPAGSTVNLSIPATSGGVTTLSFFVAGYEQ